MSALKSAVNTLLCSDVARIVLAVLLLVGTLALLLLDHPVPDFLIVLDGAAVGFYFGGSQPQPPRSA